MAQHAWGNVFVDNKNIPKSNYESIVNIEIKKKELFQD